MTPLWCSGSRCIGIALSPTTASVLYNDVSAAQSINAGENPLTFSLLGFILWCRIIGINKVGEG